MGARKHNLDLPFFMDSPLRAGLDLIKNTCQGKDEDWLGIVVGKERSGKSVFGMQLGWYLARPLPFTADNVVYTVKEFVEAIYKAPRGSSIIFDEAGRGGSSSQRWTVISNILRNTLMETGQKNLKLLLITPSIFELTPYLKYERSKVLFLTYKVRTRKGFWAAWFGDNKNNLIYKASKARKFGVGVKQNLGGTFPNYYTIPEEIYRKKKADYFMQNLSKDLKTLHLLDKLNLEHATHLDNIEPKWEDMKNENTIDNDCSHCSDDDVVSLQGNGERTQVECSKDGIQEWQEEKTKEGGQGINSKLQ